MQHLLERAQEIFKPIQKVRSISETEFESQYALPQIPVVLEKMTEKWPANNRWLLSSLRDKYGNHLVKVTHSDTKSEKRMTLKEYIDYMEKTDDDHPYYLKDWVFGEDFPEMKNDYEILPHFSNWLDSLPSELNPKFSWLYIGPRNSYSKIHLDIFLTNAWNMLVEGKKLWLFFPPSEMFNLHNKPSEKRFADYGFPDLPGLNGFYAIQEPGEIMFTPGNWYHQVFNLDNTVAVTENYVNHTNYEIVEKHLVQHKKEDVLHLLNKLKTQFLN